ncbi:MAG: DNA-binding protein Alba [Thaumarchaeota archaeon]|nr:DNA-binding protein Alba [Nitrososphaerota archaeon]
MSAPESGSRNAKSETKPAIASSPAPPAPRPPRTSPSNHVYIGKKPVMSYAMSALIQLSQSTEIILKARGMVISRAVDVAEIVTKRLGNNAFSVKDIKIGTERVGEGEESRNVSTIEISIGPK